MTNKISVVTCYYNDEDFLANCIQSVLKQTFTDYEYILVNHASTDSSRKIAHSFEDKRIKHIDLPINYGASSNLTVQEALNIATGDYVKLLSADDILLPDALEKLLKKAEETNAEVIFGDVLFVDIQGQSLEKTWFKNRYPIPKSNCSALHSFLLGNSIFPYPGNLININVLKNIHLDYISVNTADMGIWVQALLLNYKFEFISEIVAKYRIHPKQMCSNKNVEIINIRNYFEQILYYQNIFQYKLSINVLKKLFPKDSFIEKLQCNDEKLSLFAFAQAIFKQTENSQVKIIARMKMAEELQKYNLYKTIEKYGYNMAIFRKEIVELPLYVISNKRNFVKNSEFKLIFYAFIRKFYFFVTFRFVMEKLKNNPKDDFL